LNIPCLKLHVPLYDVIKEPCAFDAGDSHDKHEILNRKQIETPTVPVLDEIEQVVDVQF